MTVCEKIMQLRDFSPEVVDSVVEELRQSVTAIMEGIEDGRPEDALGCCEDLI